MGTAVVAVTNAVTAVNVTDDTATVAPATVAGLANLGIAANVKNVITDYGAKGDGTTDDTTKLQQAIDDIDTAAKGGVVYLPPGKTYYITQELQLRADHCTFYAVGATILGPVTHTTAGDLFTIGDRRTASRVIDDAHLVGGCWQPQAAADNAVGMIAATRSSVRGVVVTLPTGTASGGVLLETTASCTDVTIDGCIVTGGGAEGIRAGLTSASFVLTGLTISNCICDGQVNGLVVRGDLDTAQVLSATITNVSVRNCSGDALQFYRLTDSTVSNCTAANVSGHGCYIYQPKNTVWSNLSLHSATTPTASKYGVITQNGTAGGSHLIRGVNIVGAWTAGVKNEAQDGQFADIHVSGATTAVTNNAAARTVWRGLTYDGVTTPVSNVSTVTDDWVPRPQLVGTNFSTPVSADNGDADVTLQADTAARWQRFATTLTANRTVTLSTTNAIRGDTFRVIRTGLGNFTLNVGGLKTIPSATAAFVDVVFTGAAWVLAGYGAL